MIAGLLSATAVLAQPQLDRHNGQLAAAPKEERIDSAASVGTDQRIDALVDETGQLRAKIAAQSDLLHRLITGLDGLLPRSPQQESGVLESDRGELAACRSEIAELSTRLQQQRLVLDETQRRAEKAEKATAAMNEAQAHAATEIERLSTELAMAKARQTEALQQAVELERRLATAEARVARFTTNGQQALAVAEGSVMVPSEPSAVEAKRGAETGAEDVGAAPSATAVQSVITAPDTLQSPERSTVQPAAPVFYEVRAADTLSRISARVYGDPSAWERIYDANRDLLTAPDALSPGMSLVIP